jgi:mannose-6-phosphate isomerase
MTIRSNGSPSMTSHHADHSVDAWKGPLLLDAPMVHRVWGGTRFQAPHGPIGEVWLVHEDNVIRKGPLAGSTLASATSKMGSELLGRRLSVRGEREFPLLIKLIDAAEWLSIQVHPDDERAAQLEGPSHRGKTEAWYVLESNPGAQVIAGLKPEILAAQLENALGSRAILDLFQRHELLAGDAVLLPAGAVHALGPGMLIYEIQQSSDITYRIYDWDRPPGEGRTLHLEQSRRSVEPSLRISVEHITDPPPGELTAVAASEYFTLQLGCAGPASMAFDTKGEAFHVVTVIQGTATLTGTGWTLPLNPYETAVIPAATGPYAFVAGDTTRFLLAQPG